MSDKIARGDGPEPTKYDRRRHEEMNLRPIGRFYGNTFIGLSSFDPYPVCCQCGREIITPHVIICGDHFHNECYKGNSIS